MNFSPRLWHTAPMILQLHFHIKHNLKRFHKALSISSLPMSQDSFSVVPSHSLLWPLLSSFERSKSPYKSWTTNKKMFQLEMMVSANDQPYLDDTQAVTVRCSPSLSLFVYLNAATHTQSLRSRQHWCWQNKNGQTICVQSIRRRVRAHSGQKRCKLLCLGGAQRQSLPAASDRHANDQRVSCRHSRRMDSVPSVSFTHGSCLHFCVWSQCSSYFLLCQR